MTSLVAAAQPARDAARTITWDDVAPAHALLNAAGVSAATFGARATAIRNANARRVHEGDLDHLVFYVLQSTSFTDLLPIEPALSAKRFAETSEIPDTVRARARSFLRAGFRRGDERLSYFHTLARTTFIDHDREAALLREYARVMKFVYEKEFVAQRSERRQAAVAELYRTRGLSTDTAVEAGFLVADGLAVARALNPALRVRRVLIVGPGLDLAPRTGLLEAGPPESYQPWAVIDALLALGLARAGDLTVTGADINQRVVHHLRRAAGRARTVTFVTGIRETGDVTLAPPFREYFETLGRQLEARESVQPPRRVEARRVEQRGAPRAASGATAIAGHLSKVVRIDPGIARSLGGVQLDIVTERLAGPFDLVVATNILPYFDDVEFLLAMTNIASMLAPGGLFLHNESRPLMEEVASAVGLPKEQSRHSIIASVRGAPPLGDSIFLHRKSGR